jgi:activator of HSP90 ATPase
VVSPDTEFAPVGDKTKIKYREDFNKYKKILIVGKNLKSIQALFDWYNAALLDNHGKDTQPQDDRSNNDGNEIQDTLDQLEGDNDGNNGDEQASADNSGSDEPDGN